MFKSLIIVATIASTLAASTTQADHRGRGGRGSNFGIGIGGGGVGVYYGRGGGWNRGGWGGGWNRGGWGGYGWGYPGYGYGGYSSGYYYPNYSSGYYYSTPSYGTTVVDPVLPAGPASPSFDGGSIVLTNPATNTKTVEYALNGQIFSMKPGQSQRFTHDRDWIVEFNKGISLGRYSLKSSNYKFKRTGNGWELFEQADSRPTADRNPAPPTDDPLRSAGRLEPADETQRIERRELVPPPVPDEDRPQPRDSDRNTDDGETVIRPRQVPQP